MTPILCTLALISAAALCYGVSETRYRHRKAATAALLGGAAGLWSAGALALILWIIF
jgi:hypothetical protein